MRAFQASAFQNNAFQVRWTISKTVFKITAYFATAFISARHGRALLKSDGGKSQTSLSG